MLRSYSCSPHGTVSTNLDLVEQTECLHCLKRKWVNQANEYQLSNGLSGGMCALVEDDLHDERCTPAPQCRILHSDPACASLTSQQQPCQLLPAPSSTLPEMQSNLDVGERTSRGEELNLYQSFLKGVGLPCLPFPWKDISEHIPWHQDSS
ncbi:uncharacterized protein AAG666_025961 isoform 2-T2 [Megaptera novaeangliae]